MSTASSLSSYTVVLYLAVCAGDKSCLLMASIIIRTSDWAFSMVPQLFDFFEAVSDTEFSRAESLRIFSTSSAKSKGRDKMKNAQSTPSSRIGDGGGDDGDDDEDDNTDGDDDGGDRQIGHLLHPRCLRAPSQSGTIRPRCPGAARRPRRRPRR